MPKLSAEVVAFINGDGGLDLDVTKLPRWESYGAATRAALLLAQGGVRVFPCVPVDHCREGTCHEARLNGECKSHGKHPRIANGVIKATDNIGRITEWADRWPESNWGQALDARVVVDIDTHDGKEGVAQWDALLIKHYKDRNPSALPYLPEELQTLQYRTGRGGQQLVFLRPPSVPDSDIPGLLADHIDIKRGRHSYVMVPGSVTDAPYEVTRDVEPRILPMWIVQAAKNRKKADKAAKTRAAKAAGSASGTGLSAELALPRSDPGKGNTWMTKVAGFLAAGLRREEDLFVILRRINELDLDDPIAEAELLKITRSVVEREIRNHHGPADGEGIDTDADHLHSEEFGYIATTPDHQRMVVLNDAGGGEEGTVAVPVTYMNCSITPRYVIDVGDDRYYDLEVRGPNHEGSKHALIRGEILVDTKLRDKWLSGLGYAVSPPHAPVYKLADKVRLLWHIEAHRPPRGRAVDALGWSGTDFLTPEGVLRDGKIEPFDGAIPRPQAVEQSMAAYGTDVGKEELRDVLREVWTFQEPQVASVAMAWWVMCLLKGTYESSIAPILYVDAPSGSGKTNGFFAFLVALAGNTSGSGSITVPRVRHQLASNRNGIVWVDDMSDMRNLSEVLRQAASKGTHTKTDTNDNMTTIQQHMVGNVLLSCEGMGRTLEEKAMRDRVIHLKVGSVKGRQSLTSDRAQWWDIVDLLGRYASQGEYAAFARKMAGTAVALVSEYATVRLQAHMEKNDGRHAEKHAMLRAGAEILADILGFDDPIRHVSAWIDGDEDRGGENLFIGHLAGRLWRDLGQPTDAVVDRFGQKRPAAIFADEEGLVYVSPQHCADEFARMHGLDARDRQLTTAEAIVAELQECGLLARSCRVRRRFLGAEISYWRLTETLSARARGVWRSRGAAVDQLL